MIKNEKEYRSARAALAGYEESIVSFDVLKLIESGVDPVIAKAQLASYRRQAMDLRQSVGAYEALKSGKTVEVDVTSLDGLGSALVEARIAKGLTQRELANISGLQEQQIQRYEKELYSSANLRRLVHISESIGARFGGKLISDGQGAADSDLPGGLTLADFPFTEMNTRKWFGEGGDLRRKGPAEKLRALREFFTDAPRDMHAALHRKTTGSISPARQAALLAWQARVLMRARRLTGLARRFSTPSPEVLSNIAKFSANTNGIKSAVEMLLGYGIIVVFEKHLPKTKLDGAAMSLDGTYAVIGITVRHDRLDNFWFVLLHELGHVIRHWRRVLEGGIVDEDAGEESEELIEREADEFAENAILPRTTWLASTVRFTKSPESVRSFASRHGIHPALIAGRIRRERGYTEFSDMLGSGTVRSALHDAGLLES